MKKNNKEQMKKKRTGQVRGVSTCNPSPHYRGRERVHKQQNTCSIGSRHSFFLVILASSWRGRSSEQYVYQHKKHETLSGKCDKADLSKKASKEGFRWGALSHWRWWVDREELWRRRCLLLLHMRQLRRDAVTALLRKGS